jgi:hypothetical protein
MPDPVDTLILDLLEWIGPKARPYREVMEAWRTLELPQQGYRFFSFILAAHADKEHVRQ